MSRHASPPVTALASGALVGLGMTAAGVWVAAIGADVPEEALAALIGGWVESNGAALILPAWVQVALGVGMAAAGAVILWAVGDEALRRLRGGAPAAPSERTRSIAGLIISVGAGAFFSLVGAVMVLASAGVIATEGGGEPEMPWFLGGIGAVVTLASLLMTFSSVYQWMGGTGAAQRRRRDVGVRPASGPGRASR